MASRGITRLPEALNNPKGLVVKAALIATNWEPWWNIQTASWSEPLPPHTVFVIWHSSGYSSEAAVERVNQWIVDSYFMSLCGLSPPQMSQIVCSLIQKCHVNHCGDGNPIQRSIISYLPANMKYSCLFHTKWKAYLSGLCTWQKRQWMNISRVICICVGHLLDLYRFFCVRDGG